MYYEFTWRPSAWLRVLTTLKQAHWATITLKLWCYGLVKLWTETKKLVDGEFKPYQNLCWTVAHFVCLIEWHTLSTLFHQHYLTYYIYRFERCCAVAVASKWRDVFINVVSKQGQCAQHCPVYVSVIHDYLMPSVVSTSMKLQNKAVSEIVCWRVNTSRIDMSLAVYAAEQYSTLQQTCRY